MNQWAFVVAAYALVIGVSGVLLLASWRAMRRAEADAEAAREGR